MDLNQIQELFNEFNEQEEDLDKKCFEMIAKCKNYIKNQAPISCQKAQVYCMKLYNLLDQINDTMEYQNHLIAQESTQQREEEQQPQLEQTNQFQKSWLDSPTTLPLMFLEYTDQKQESDLLRIFSENNDFLSQRQQSVDIDINEHVNKNQYFEIHDPEIYQALQKFPFPEQLQQQLQLNLEKVLNLKTDKDKNIFDLVLAFLPSSWPSYFNPNAHSEQSQSSQTVHTSYRKYSQQFKDLMVTLYFKKISVSELHKLFNVPPKNIKRWVTSGTERKKGGGRAPCYKQIEELLLNWCCEEIEKKQIIPQNSQLIQKARSLADNPSFKASKCWIQKFKKRAMFNLKMANLIRNFEKIEH